jgi:hypothetical protein
MPGILKDAPVKELVKPTCFEVIQYEFDTKLAYLKSFVNIMRGECKVFSF